MGQPHDFYLGYLGILLWAHQYAESVSWVTFEGRRKGTSVASSDIVMRPMVVPGSGTVPTKQPPQNLHPEGREWGMEVFPRGSSPIRVARPGTESNREEVQSQHQEVTWSIGHQWPSLGRQRSKKSSFAIKNYGISSWQILSIAILDHISYYMLSLTLSLIIMFPLPSHGFLMNKNDRKLRPGAGWSWRTLRGPKRCEQFFEEARLPSSTKRTCVQYLAAPKKTTSGSIFLTSCVVNIKIELPPKPGVSGCSSGSRAGPWESQSLASGRQMWSESPCFLLGKHRNFTMFNHEITLSNRQSSIDLGLCKVKFRLILYIYIVHIHHWINHDLKGWCCSVFFFFFFQVFEEQIQIYYIYYTLWPVYFTELWFDMRTKSMWFHGPSCWLAGSRYRLGAALSSLSRFPEAQEAFEEALRRRPEDQDVSWARKKTWKICVISWDVH